MKFRKLFVLGPQAGGSRTDEGVRQYVSVRLEMSGQDVSPSPLLPVDQEKLILLTATHFVPAAFFFLLTVRWVGGERNNNLSAPLDNYMIEALPVVSVSKCLTAGEL